MSCLRIWIKGRVQGVGFRPFIYNLATAFNLKGFVKNTSDGLFIEIEGEKIKDFLEVIKTSAPVLSKIESIEQEEIEKKGFKEFKILKSEESKGFTHVSPDVGICDKCLKEMLDFSNRRYLYPFINCTTCGPRYSIITKLPYDRENTTMSVFKMCKACEKEYNNPLDRRFHAQPNACAVCGPSVSLKLINSEYKKLLSDNPIESSIKILKMGGILAIKGLGGFHIVCCAEDKNAILRLRKNKERGNKPFALMAPDIDTIEKFCYINTKERELLLSSERPIVLLQKKENCPLPNEIAPQNKYLGFMLPYTPLHYLLFFYTLEKIHKINFSSLIMTSGNLSEEPIIHKNNIAIQKLANIVDGFLLHNRDIFMRVDDSVVTSEIFIRRARGYVPQPINLATNGEEVLGVGSDIKNTFTLTKGKYAIMSQHIGDMENYETLLFFEETFEKLCYIYKIKPSAIGADLHPDYHTTRWAESQMLPLYKFQHHYAHIASVMAEHLLKEEVIGVVFDGTGYGTDGNVWGGEFIIADNKKFYRLAHLKYMSLPGGNIAVKQPWRMAISVLKEVFHNEFWEYIDKIGLLKRIEENKIINLMKIIDNKEFSPLSSSIGRLFDAVASLIGLKDINTFEAEAPISLESILINEKLFPYPYEIYKKNEIFIIDYRPIIYGIVKDLQNKIPKEIISTKFHWSIVNIVIDMIKKLSWITGIKKVVISGGVFQNIFILKNIKKILISKDFKIYHNKNIPPNDACISLGQAYLIREKLKK